MKTTVFQITNALNRIKADNTIQLERLVIFKNQQNKPCKEKKNKKNTVSVNNRRMSNGLILRKIGHIRNGKGIEEIFKVLTVENDASSIK